MFRLFLSTFFFHFYDVYTQKQQRFMSFYVVFQESAFKLIFVMLQNVLTVILCIVFYQFYIELPELPYPQIYIC